MKQITILLAEDHIVVREAFRMMLELENDLKVVGEAQDGRQAVALVKRLRPTVVLMDIAMPRLNGLEAARQILKAVPTTKVVMLSAQSEAAYVKKATDYGATGFLRKQTTARVLYEAIREVNKGKNFFCPEIANRLNKQNRKSLLRPGLSRRRGAGLTSREKEVLQLVAEGSANKQTAVELGIAVKTVENHRKNLMQKLDIHDTAGLTRYAIAAGIIESSVLLTFV
jgi:DNA-binding NarL/FixJ family response regulator